MSDIKRPLRSTAWFGHTDKDGFLHRSWMKNQGFPDDLFDGRPVIGICNTWSELTPCNAHLRDLAERVKRGVYEAGGFPLEFPVFSTGESNLRPTAMLFRNLAAMDVEEAIRGNPVDGVVLMTGCDKTTPALLMGAASCDVPAIVCSGGPMLNGKYRGQDIGSGTDVWRFSEMVRAGEMSLKEFMDAEAGMSRSPGHCMVMGTASTMNSMAEALGMSLPGCAAIPAVDSRRRTMAQLTGRLSRPRTGWRQVDRQGAGPCRRARQGGWRQAVRQRTRDPGSLREYVRPQAGHTPDRAGGQRHLPCLCRGRGADRARVLHGFVMDRSSQRVMIVASAEGGMEIEDISADKPESIVRSTVEPAVGLQDFQAREIAFALGVEAGLVSQMVRTLQGCYPRLFRAGRHYGGDQPAGGHRRRQGDRTGRKDDLR